MCGRICVTCIPLFACVLGVSCILTPSPLHQLACTRSRTPAKDVRKMAKERASQQVFARPSSGGCSAL
ncbi:hypothetical protein E2C01_056318 [Portunus trituberculatus]|uniref:Secreted protein n=1 Tax=Portunus trituberculatus TaxID=210409 RepID=A0A5B7GXR5_PORTR|nr:hypothetical protein [Portunus trituberculatus]